MIEITNFDGTRVEKVLTEEEQGMMIEEVWENANPTSSFAAQTLPVDVSDATLVMIDFAFATTDRSTRYVHTGIVGAFNIFYFPTSLMGNGLVGMACRGLTPRIGNRNIEFRDGLLKGANQTTPTTNNTYCIPMRIYKCKL